MSRKAVNGNYWQAPPMARGQIQLLPASLDKRIPDDHPVRIIDEILDRCDDCSGCPLAPKYRKNVNAKQGREVTHDEHETARRRHRVQIEAGIGDALQGSAALRRDSFRGAEGVLRYGALSASGSRRGANRISMGLHCVQSERDDDAADQVSLDRRQPCRKNSMLRNIGVLRGQILRVR